MRNNPDKYSWSGRKKKTFSKNVVLPQNWNNWMLFFLFEMYIPGIEIRPERAKTYEVRAECNSLRLFYISGSDWWNRSQFLCFLFLYFCIFMYLNFFYIFVFLSLYIFIFLFLYCHIFKVLYYYIFILYIDIFICQTRGLDTKGVKLV